MFELVIHETFPLKDNDKYVDVVASVSKQFGSNPDVEFGTPAIVEFEFYCMNRCEYPHRVCSDAHKWVIGALVVAGVLPGCGWNRVCGFIDTFHIDEMDPRVVVRIV